MAAPFTNMVCMAAVARRAFSLCTAPNITLPYQSHVPDGNMYSCMPLINWKVSSVTVAEEHVRVQVHDQDHEDMRLFVSRTSSIVAWPPSNALHACNLDNPCYGVCSQEPASTIPAHTNICVDTTARSSIV
jgi:hypothetical protein